MATDWEHKNLINELNQGKQWAEELMKHLNNISSPQTREFLIEKLLSSYEKALSLLNFNGFPVLESPSPYPDSHNNVFKKRKTEQKYTEQVKVCSVSSLEGPADDGYNWRKYGQKDIVGANFPRGYYRCSHRHSQGCLAVKQVQRSDEDPSVVEVTYKGRHTCVQSSHLPHPNHESKQSLGDSTTKQLVEKTEDDLGVFPWFSFLEKENERSSHQNFGEISPATSESNYFSSAASCHVDNFGLSYYVQTPESNLNRMIPFPMEEFDFSNIDLDTNFQFENLEFLA